MPHAPKPELIQTELATTLERFHRYLTGTRFDRKRKLRENTARSYAGMMRAVMHWTGSLEPTLQEAQGFLAHLSDGHETKDGTPPSDSTKRTAFFAVKAWFEWKRQPLTDEQERGFLVPPTPRNTREAPLGLDQIQALLGRIPDARRYAIIRTLLATGIRRAELAALKVKHIDFTARKVWVPEIGEGGRAAAKGGSGGWVCISPVALQAIAEHLRSRKLGGAPDAPLFESLGTADHLHPDSVTSLVGDLTHAVLGRRVTPHELRHAFASYAAAGDKDRPPMPIKALQAQLRHKRDTTTLRYIHAVANHDEAYERSAPSF